MEMKDIIEKVNYYAKLSKERKLTEEETKDREIYRRMYLDQFKAQVKEHLDNIEIVDDKFYHGFCKFHISRQICKSYFRFYHPKFRSMSCSI